MCKQNRTTQTQSGSKKQKGAIILATITGATRHKAKRGRKEASDLPVSFIRAPHERSPVVTALGLDVGAGGQQLVGHPPVTQHRRSSDNFLADQANKEPNTVQDSSK